MIRHDDHPPRSRRPPRQQAPHTPDREHRATPRRRPAGPPRLGHSSDLPQGPPTAAPARRLATPRRLAAVNPVTTSIRPASPLDVDIEYNQNICAHAAGRQPTCPTNTQPATTQPQTRTLLNSPGFAWTKPAKIEPHQDQSGQIWTNLDTRTRFFVPQRHRKILP